MRIGIDDYQRMRGGLFPEGMCSESRDRFNFWKITDNILETTTDRDIITLKDKKDRKAFVAY